jgi:hypothetical protein
VAPVSEDQISKLKKIAPTAIYFSTIADSDSTDTASSDNEGNDEGDIPPTIPFIINSFKCKSSEEMKAFIKPENIAFLEHRTTNQRNKLWLEQRCGRLTSSNFGMILRKKKVSDSFIQNFLKIQPELNTPSVRWGKKNEAVAFRSYSELSQSKHTNFKLRQCGLFISEEDPYLGSSPDGIVECDCCGKGVIEIKCPFKYRNEDPSKIPQLDTNFFLDSNGIIKDSHSYYAQIQGQMAITNRDFCDLIVWTSVNMYITRVARDRLYWEETKPILENFFFNHIAPSIAGSSSDNKSI